MGGNALMGFGVEGRYADVDLDGAMDLLVSDRYYPGGGAVFVFRGPLTQDLDISDADAVYQPGTGTGEYALFGQKFDVGDANGDGFVDLLAGAAGWSWDGYSAGAAFLFHGPLVASHTTQAADFSLFGDHPFAQVGADVDFVGDVDGDGREDFIVGAPNWGPTPVVTSPCDTSDPYGCIPQAQRGNGAVMLFVESPLGRQGVRDAAMILYDDRPNDLFGQVNQAIGDQTGDGFDDFYLADPTRNVAYLISPCELALVP
jgi:hypothetical protein